MRARRRTQPATTDHLDNPQPAVPPDAAVADRDRDAQLWAAINRLPACRRRLMRALMTDPPPSYDELSDQLDMPVGSIGPTRARCLQQLRDQLDAADLACHPEPTDPYTRPPTPMRSAPSWPAA